MNSDLIIQHMLSQQLLNDQDVSTIMSATSDHQKNCLVFEKVRSMDNQSLVSFCRILQMFDNQKHIAAELLNGKSIASFIINNAIIIAYSFYSIAALWFHQF